MDRLKIVEAILAQIRTEDHRAVRKCLAYLTDTNLLSYAVDMGVNTDEVLFQNLVNHARQYNTEVL